MRLHFGEVFNLLASGGGVDKNEAADLAGIALGEPK